MTEHELIDAVAIDIAGRMNLNSDLNISELRYFAHAFLREFNETIGQHDLSSVIRLTHTKTKDIVDRTGHKITGFVLTKDNGEKCIVDMSAVRWFFDPNDFHQMMHPA